MASLTIGGQVYPLEPTARELAQAEHESMKAGGRPFLAAFAGAEATRGFFGVQELEHIVLATWRRTRSDDRNRALVDQFFQDGGTLFELHQEVLTALLDSGLVGRRTPTNGTGPPMDPPTAGAPGS